MLVVTHHSRIPILFLFHFIFRFIAYVLCAPAWGILADHKRIHLLVVLLLCGASFVLMVSQPFITIPFSTIPADTQNNSTQWNSSSSRNSSSTGNVFLSSETTENLDTKNTNGRLFVIMMVLNLITTCFDGSTQGFVDAGVMQRIKSFPNRDIDFGTTRLFGAIGYGSGTLASSIAIEYLVVDWLPSFVQVFIVYGVYMAGLMASTWCLYRKLDFSSKLDDHENNSLTCLDGALNDQVPLEDGEKQHTVAGNHSNEAVGKLLRTTLLKISTMFFFATILVVGIIHGTYISFLFVLLKEIECPNVVMGLSICVASFSSVIAIKFCEPAIKLLGGAMEVLCVCTFSWCVRFLAYYFLHQPYLVLPIQLLQGFGKSFFIMMCCLNSEFFTLARISHSSHQDTTLCYFFQLKKNIRNTQRSSIASGGRKSRQ